VLAGIIIGAVLGMFFFIVPAKFLISGPIKGNELMLPPGVQEYILGQTWRWGGISGAIIGFLCGFNNDATLPRGDFSKMIGVLCFIVSTVSAWWTQWDCLANTSFGRIIIIVLVTFAMFIIAVPVSGYFSFIESIRERD
jgi:hypothetical protein